MADRNPGGETRRPAGDAGAPKDGVIPQVPDHELLRKIGSGSYGEVWLARSLTGSYRAVKVVYRASFKDTAPFGREFAGIQKFEPISRSHEGFVDILQVGKNDRDGYFYYVMEPADDLASGQNIDPAKYSPKTLSDELAKRRRLPHQECLQLGLSLTAALEHLHKHKLVHRDIKPSNIIFVNGVPKFADIGLVTDMGQSTYVGTEGYIPPEGPGSPQADLFALGKVLYEISTGKDRLRFPALPSNSAEVDSILGLMNLNDVILRACENDIRKRYQTAYEMHADLKLLQLGKNPEWERKKRRWKKIAVAGAAIALVAVATIIVLQNHSKNVENNGGASVPLAVVGEKGTTTSETLAPPKSEPPVQPLPATVASLPAADVLKIAYGATVPPAPAQFEKPKLQLNILVKRAGETAFKPLNDGDALASEKDDYRIEVRALSAGYLYLFQVDSTGKKEWLFPKNETSALSSGANPVQSGDTILLPPTDSKRSLYLDKTTGIEHIYGVFSASPWPELEKALAHGPSGTQALADSSTAPLHGLVQQPNQLRTRGVGGARITEPSQPIEASGSLLVVERWFRHVAPE